MYLIVTMLRFFYFRNLLEPFRTCIYWIYWPKKCNYAISIFKSRLIITPTFGFETRKQLDSWFIVFISIWLSKWKNWRKVDLFELQNRHIWEELRNQMEVVLLLCITINISCMITHNLFNSYWRYRSLLHMQLQNIKWLRIINKYTNTPFMES